MNANAKNIPINERIIFALDLDSVEEAEIWVKKLKSHICFFKVGLQLFLSSWFRSVDMILSHGCKVMCDIKLFDIPETVALAVDTLKNRGVTFVTIHGNDPIIRAAVAHKGELKILSVTVLTSFDENDMRTMGMTGSIEDLVLIRAKRSIELGCDGIVSSGLEAFRMRHEIGSNFLIVTPGIRPGQNIRIQEDDQKRIVTAQMAVINGADHVVVGRPIRNAADPIAVVESMQREIMEGLGNILA